MHGVSVFCGSRHRILVYCSDVDYHELTLLSTLFAIADNIRYSISTPTHISLTRIILWSRTTFLIQFNVNAATRMITITPNTAMMMTMFSFWLSPSPSAYCNKEVEKWTWKCVDKILQFKLTEQLSSSVRNRQLTWPSHFSSSLMQLESSQSNSSAAHFSSEKQHSTHEIFYFQFHRFCTDRPPLTYQSIIQSDGEDWRWYGGRIGED